MEAAAVTDVVLLYQRNCPNVAPARSNLMRALSRASVEPSWREMDLDDVETPVEWRKLGSPTILVDGEDVAGGVPGDGATCRLYDDGGRMTGAPSVDAIAACLGAGRRCADVEARGPEHAPPARSVPSVLVDGKLASCCATRGVDEASLRQDLA
jgi:hypothetical protein